MEATALTICCPLGLLPYSPVKVYHLTYTRWDLILIFSKVLILSQYLAIISVFQLAHFTMLSTISYSVYISSYRTSTITEMRLSLEVVTRNWGPNEEADYC